ncbi:Modification methylase FokI [Limihaloglobus sulfuriphilus]|uniref:site-specific DNA-methyltransferase (adenine-specific) n=1 Tax=Limihaloglobus sulfuriphilus TaxID=1851148 RepID=A0A1Q2MCW8_9BACT|nr:DNA adenine methylase [Limihaloglobus sulfuriphilus]AQQ70388.1 Modification methylase FokI [Limihaloglobus sulfuriphilus]
MRFIGNKENLVETIYSVISDKKISGDSFFDACAGTVSVARYFKNKDYRVVTSDLLYFSYVLQRAYIVNNSELSFSKLLNTIESKKQSLFSSPLEMVVNYLNHIKPIKGFVSVNYTPGGTDHLDIPRMYYSDYNGKKIDAIRIKIEYWKAEDLINEDEYYVLLACLIETVPFYANITGVYAAFCKKWDPRALKKIILRPIGLVLNHRNNESYNQDSASLLEHIDTDILYIDPPYNQRQYAPNYHILETIARYDQPNIRGVSGMRNYRHQKSRFCNKNTALNELAYYAKKGNFKTLILSYNSEGIMPEKDILSVLSDFGNVELLEFDYLRYKSNNGKSNRNKKYVKEQLYILRKT